MHILQCMGSKFCVKFQRAPLKFHTNLWTHTPQNVHFTVLYFCVWVTISLNCDVISLSETGPRVHKRLQRVMQGLFVVNLIAQWRLWTIHDKVAMMACFRFFANIKSLTLGLMPNFKNVIPDNSIILLQTFPPRLFCQMEYGNAHFGVWIVVNFFIYFNEWLECISFTIVKSMH